MRDVIIERSSLTFLLSAYEKNSNQPDVHGQPWKSKSRQLLECAENEEDVAEQLQAEDNEVAQVHVCRLARRVEPCRSVTETKMEKQEFELSGFSC